MRRHAVTSTGMEHELSQCGFAFVHAAMMRESLERFGRLSDWEAFAASWDDLELDEYLAEGQRCRRRRFAVYTIDRGGSIERQPHQPHYQGREYNVLFGGIARWFAPVLPEPGSGPTMRAILRCCDWLFRARMPATADWHVEVHQFRIEARHESPGQPTPEGIHRDGVDFVLVLLVSRDNIVSGTTTAYGSGGEPLGSFTLTDPLDAALVDDARCYHGVTPVEPENPGQLAYRDVLVVTFRKKAP